MTEPPHGPAIAAPARPPGRPATGWAFGLLEVLGGAILMVLMLLTTVDVVGRYVFNSPLRGAFEVTELMLAVLIFAGLPLVTRHQEHIVVDLLENRLPYWLRGVLDRFANVVSGAILLGLSKLLLTKASRIADAGDYTSVLHIAYAPFVVMMAVLVALSGLIHLYFVVRPPEPRASDADGTV